MTYLLITLLLIQCKKSSGQNSVNLSMANTSRTAATTSSNSTGATQTTDFNATLFVSIEEEIVTKAVIEQMVSSWDEWRCTRNCSIRDMIRKRTCRSGLGEENCTLPLEEMKPAECFKNKCPLDCPQRTFGDDCKYKCWQCVSPCDKFTGECDGCHVGFDFPQTGCQFDRRSFEHWSQWSCTEDCTISKYIRIRNCKRDENNKLVQGCKEPVNDTKPGNCFIGTICPKDCEDYKWGVNCEGSCINCFKPCNKFTGVCESCRPGFQSPELYCSETCFVNQYGLNCKGNCFDKCGEDCVERVTGNCREISTSSLYLFYLLLLIIPISVFVYFVMQRKQAIDVALTKSMPAQQVNKSKVTLVIEATTTKSTQSLKGNKSDKSLRDSNMSVRSLKPPAGVEAGPSIASSKTVMPAREESGILQSITSKLF